MKLTREATRDLEKRRDPEVKRLLRLGGVEPNKLTVPGGGEERATQNHKDVRPEEIGRSYHRPKSHKTVCSLSLIHPHKNH